MRNYTHLYNCRSCIQVPQIAGPLARRSIAASCIPRGCQKMPAASPAGIAACMAHVRRKIHDVHARVPTDIITEALQRIGELYAIEAEVRGCSAEQRLAARKARAAPLMQSLYDWIQQQMKTLSRHSDTAKAFAYLLKQWEALNVYCSNGWVEIDNNIEENALRGVAVGRKNWLFVSRRSTYGNNVKIAA